MFSIRHCLARLPGVEQGVKCISTSQPLDRLRNIDQVIPKNVFKGHQNNLDQENGKIYDRKPFKLHLEKGRKYAWCLCGHSKSQPLCDGTHKIQELNIKHKPIFFEVEETKEYWLCNCKQTAHRPFCDGTHLPLQDQEKEKKTKRQE